MKSKIQELAIYKLKNGEIRLREDARKETIWATQKQIAEIFDVNVRTVNEHIKNIYREKELYKTPTIRKFQIVQTEGKRTVSRDIVHYNLDLIISVGYRVNSKKATKFRQWATRILREHITTGFTVNKKRVAQNYNKFIKAVESVQALSAGKTQIGTDEVMELSFNDHYTFSG